jgi:hypothetical protein
MRAWDTPISSRSFFLVGEVLEKTGPFEVQRMAHPICLSALALTKVVSQTYDFGIAHSV